MLVLVWCQHTSHCKYLAARCSLGARTVLPDKIT